MRQEIFNEFQNKFGNSLTLTYTLGDIIKSARGTSVLRLLKYDFRIFRVLLINQLLVLSNTQAVPTM